MTKNTTSKTSEMPSNVSIVDGKLILSLPNAKMPVVWQANIEKAQSCLFTIQEDKKAKSFALILKAQGGNIDEIAQFDKKLDAAEILMEISNVLQNAHGQIAPSSSAMLENTITSLVNETLTSLPKKEKSDNKVGAILSLVLIFLLLLIWFISASNNINNQGSGSVFKNPQSSDVAQGSSGVAVSADDFLNNR